MRTRDWRRLAVLVCLGLWTGCAAAPMNIDSAPPDDPQSDPVDTANYFFWCAMRGEFDALYPLFAPEAKAEMPREKFAEKFNDRVNPKRRLERELLGAKIGPENEWIRTVFSAIWKEIKWQSEALDRDENRTLVRVTVTTPAMPDKADSDYDLYVALVLELGALIKRHAEQAAIEKKTRELVTLLPHRAIPIDVTVRRVGPKWYIDPEAGFTITDPSP
jgi:hypothetical protein